MSDSNLGSSVSLGQALAHEVDVPAVSLGRSLREHGIERYACVCDIEGAEQAMTTNEVVSVVDGCQQLINELHERQITGELVPIPYSSTRLRPSAA